MAVSKKPWDDVLNFDDWNKEVEDEVQQEEPNKTYVKNSVPQEIQGLGIQQQEDEIDLNDMIAKLNAQNAGYTEKAKEEEEKQKNEELEAQLDAERKRQEEKFRAQFEAESAERERIAFEEAKAQAEAEREKREKSFKAVTSKLFGKKQKNVAEEKAKERASEAEQDSGDVAGATEINSAEQDADVLECESFAETPDKEEVASENVAKEAEQEATDAAFNDETGNDVDIEEDNENASGNASDQDASSDQEIAKPENKQHQVVAKEEKKSKKEQRGKQRQVEPVAKEESLQVKPREPVKKEPVKKEKKPFFLFGKKPEAKEKDLPEKESTAEVATSKPDWEYLATHDEMTGLLNQRAFEEQKHTKRKGAYAVVYVDVNNLKYANDTMGHAAGNKLIIATADQLKLLFPGCAYRIGGDEFVAIVEYSSVKKMEKDVSDKKNAFNDALLAKTKEEKDSGLIYAASFGYATTDGSKSFEEVSAEADKAMYAVKEAYKKANPQFDMRGGGHKKAKEKQKEEAPKDYDSMLSAEQRSLKKTVKDNHRPVSAQSTAQIIRDVQTKASQVIAILIADPNFDQLFIILKPEVFINIVTEMESMIDYSYLYILYEGGPQYKGSDEYLSEVTHIFEAIGNGIKSGRIRSEKDIQKIKGINVFKNIYVDM